MDGDALSCSTGHTYPYVDGIPVMLLPEETPTLGAFAQTFRRIEQFVAERAWPAIESSANGQGVDPYVQDQIGATNGNLYRSLINNLPRYPIPDLPLSESQGQTLLEIGCNWGRWCISASRKGYCVIGIDPSLDAILAARRVARQLDCEIAYLVADARHLPFRPSSIDVVFSYSVLQHFYKPDVYAALVQFAQILKPAGKCLVQMPNTFGLHNLSIQVRYGFREPGYFSARYWRPAELQTAFGCTLGSARLFADGYFSLNPQSTDKDLLPRRYRLIVSLSDFLRNLSKHLPGLKYLADSLYVESVRRL